MDKQTVCIFGNRFASTSVDLIIDKLSPRILWFSYRTKFPPIHPTIKTSDVGWGCTIRTAQMFMANVLVAHEIGKDQLFGSPLSDQTISTMFKIVQCFNDNEDSPYSIHNITRLGQDFQVAIGSWHGPNMLASILKTLNLQFPWERQIQTHVMNDGIIYKDQIDYDKPCAIMVCLKLGSSSFNKKYLKSLQYLCLSEFFSGIIGGHPRSSLFFIGCEGDDLVYLDPHVPQEYEYVHGKYSTSEEKRLLESYRSTKFKTTPICLLDPSLTVGFYCKNNEEINQLLEYLNDAPILEHGTSIIPIKSNTPQYHDDHQTLEEFDIDDFL